MHVARIPSPGPYRMIAMPVRPAGGVLTVIPEQPNPSCPPVSGECDRASATVTALLELDPACTLQCHGRDPSAFEHGTDFGQVPPPPGGIHRIQSVSPGTHSKRRIDYDDSVAFPFRLPRLDLITVCSGKAGSTGDADNFAPAEVEGFLIAGPSLMMSTSRFFSSAAAACGEHSKVSPGALLPP